MSDDEGIPGELRRLFGAIRSDPAATSGTAVDVVVEALENRNSAVRAAAADAVSDLGSVGHPRVEVAIPPVLATLEDVDPGVREAATRAVGWVGAAFPGGVSPSVDRLAALLEDDDPRVRAAAADAVARIGRSDPGTASETVPGLSTAVSDPTPRVARAAATALGDLGRRDPTVVEPAVDPLSEAIAHRSPVVAAEAVRSLSTICREHPDVSPDSAPFQRLVDAAEDDRALVRASVARALGNVDSVHGPGVEALVDRVGDGDHRVRRYAVEAMWRIASSDPEKAAVATPWLERRLDDRHPEVEEYARRALAELKS